MARINTDPIIEASLLLRDLPFNPLIDKQTDPRGYIIFTVTLRPFVGNPVSCTGCTTSTAVPVHFSLRRCNNDL